MKVVCNAGPLIVLAKLGRLDLLVKLYGKIFIPPAVNEEVVISGSIRGYANSQAAKILINAGDIIVRKAPKKMILSVLGLGEIEAINLAVHEKANLILLDDFSARTEARKVNLKVKGSVGLLIDGYTKGILTKRDCKFLLETIKGDDDIWIAEEIIDAALKQLR